MSDLCFCSAAFGSWGIVRLGSLVPECRMLFVCPYSCGRHNSIGAIKHGYKDLISYLFIDEKDIALGTMDEDIPLAAAQLVKAERPPKVVLIYFSCVLYMSGFDWDAMIEALSEEYPGIRFRACMMNPVAGDSDDPPVPAMVRTLCSLWDDGQAEESGSAVNLLGNYTRLDGENELSEVIRLLGAGEVRHFTDFDTFDGYASMGSSRLNIVVRPEGLLAAKAWQEKMDYCFVPVSYDLDEIEKQYSEIVSKLAADCPERAGADPGPEKNETAGKVRELLDGYRREASEEIEETLRVIGDRPIAVGSSAVCRPFDLARALIRYGFSVSDVFEDGCPSFERAAREELEELGTVSFHNIHDPALCDKAGHVGTCEIAVGYSAGYYSGAAHVADLMIDEGMFGYGGVIRLMRKLREAASGTSSVEAMIESYGLII